MSAPWRRSEYRSQALLLLAAFLAFAAHAAGLVNLGASAAAGIDFHEPLIDTLLDGQVPQGLLRPDCLAFLGAGALLALALPALKPIAASLLTFAAMLPPFWVAWTWPVPPPLVSLEYALLTVLVLFSLKVLLGYFQETRARQRITAAFGQYVPPALVEQLTRQPEALTMAGEAREMSVLFCDIVSFSRMSEQLEPHELARLLNEYLTAMTDVLHAHGATIDKYIGDAIMAFWGAPVTQDDHARRAVNAALDMQAAMAPLARRFEHRGWPAIACGIGINTGVVSVGNMGSRYRVAYTVVGDAVNLAARLETLTRRYRVDILVSEATRVAAALPCREIDHVRVKGKDKATRIFQPLGDTHSGADLPRHEAALAAYYEGDWSLARERWASLTALHPEDPYYAAMLARVEGGRAPADWSGVVTYGGALSYSSAAPPLDADD